MPGIPESVRFKIDRADQHIRDLDIQVTAFLHSKPYTIKGEVDATNRPTYRVSDVKPIRPEILTITGDAVQNLRTALDYLACALWSRNNPGDCERIYFPISPSATEHTSALGKIKGMRKDAIDAISRIEPFNGGKGAAFWRLHRLSIIDKHRLPLAVVGSNLGAHLPSLYPEQFPESARANPWAIIVTQTFSPLKNGDVLFVDTPDRELKQDVQFPFFVAINEVGLFECKPLLPALKELRDSVNGILSGFDPLF